MRSRADLEDCFLGIPGTRETGERRRRVTHAVTDLGVGYYQARTDTDRKIRNHIRQIQALGFEVTITKAT